MSWCLIESDPGVFSELIKNVGVKGVQVEELYSIEEDELSRLMPINGLIFLFKWTKDHIDRDSVQEMPEGLFFANQVIENACATQAILSILLNSPDIDLGPILTDFKAFTKDFDSRLKGEAIGNSEVIRNVHNSFSRPELYDMMDGQTKSSGVQDAFHFISYIQHKGKVYELDGLQNNPILLGECGDNWHSVARSAVYKRIESGGGEIRFNLMAVVKDRREMYHEQMAALQESEGNEAAIHDLLEKIDIEDKKSERYARENTWRKHNFVPFFINATRLLAQRGELMPLVEKAKRGYKNN
eukprot:CFRG7428T1